MCHTYAKGCNEYSLEEISPSEINLSLALSLLLPEKSLETLSCATFRGFFSNKFLCSTIFTTSVVWLLIIEVHILQLNKHIDIFGSSDEYL